MGALWLYKGFQALKAWTAGVSKRFKKKYIRAVAAI
jgi:hypothetical protein